MTSSDCREHTLYQNVNFVQPLNFTINCLWLWAQVYLTVYQKELFSTYVYVANHVSTQTTDKQHQFQPWQVGVYFFQHWWFLVAKVKITAKLAHPSMTQSKWKTNTQPLLEIKRSTESAGVHIVYTSQCIWMWWGQERVRVWEWSQQGQQTRKLYMYKRHELMDPRQPTIHRSIHVNCLHMYMCRNRSQQCCALGQ